MAEWQGPYQITQQVGCECYEVNMADRCKKRRILHVNMLRKWNAPCATSFLTEEVEEDQEDVESWLDTTDVDSPAFCNELNDQQQVEIQGLLQQI